MLKLGLLTISILSDFIKFVDNLDSYALPPDDTIMILESMKMKIAALAPDAARLVKPLFAECVPVRAVQGK
jgi:hypothetical protein